MIRRPLAALALAALASPAQALDAPGSALDAAIARHARANGIPEALVHRVVQRESRYNPRAVGRGGAMGLMQIKHGTARALGYAGPASGLLDAETNLTYGVRYLAGAYRVADGHPGRAVSYFARGYYYEAKRRGLAGSLAAAPALAGTVPAEAPAAVAASPVVPEAPSASAFLPVRTIGLLPPARPAAFGGAAPAPDAQETASIEAEAQPVERAHN